MSPLVRFRVSPEKNILEVVFRNKKQEILIELLLLGAVMIYTTTFDHRLQVHVHIYECPSGKWMKLLIGFARRIHSSGFLTVHADTVKVLRSGWVHILA